VPALPPGITRKSIIDLAKAKGFTVEERDVSVDEVGELYKLNPVYP
jgi:branched-subunit amino acid aminotransferase/4-amino-4-deoxychorismate lyase